jgi:hypothetical protein
LESVNLHYGEVTLNLVTATSPCGSYAVKDDEFNLATMICASNDPAASTLGEFSLFF